MKYAHQLVGVFHVAHPSVPGSVFKAISETGQDEKDGDDWKGRVNAGDDICNDLADWSNNSDSNLAEAHVDFADHKRGKGVAGEGAEEHAGYYGVGDIVIFLNLTPFVRFILQVRHRDRAESLLRMEVKPSDRVSIKYV